MSKQNINVKTFGADYSPTSTPFSVYATTRQNMDYVVNIWDTLETLSDIDEALMVLSTATEDDTVTLRLNLDGGSHNVGDQLIMAITSCECAVHIVAAGRIASYGTFILLSADSFEISPFATIMCHAASFGSYGKQGAVKEHVLFEHAQCVAMIKHYYQHFLTDEEMKRILEEGYDMWMTSDQFIERYKKRNELMAEELAAETSSLVDEDLLTEEELEAWEALSNK